MHRLVNLLVRLIAQSHLKRYYFQNVKMDYIMTTNKLHHPSDSKVCLQLVMAFIFGLFFAAAMYKAYIVRADLKLASCYYLIGLSILWAGNDLIKMKQRTVAQVFIALISRLLPAIVALLVVLYV